ncbi:Aste57867_24516 [Aphanomyces stellatus]|uniref:Aste57867_24516 protein n=1 Tax=Aphanomyces stellatus TaxID=120398 RepID=A0A485LQU8_9STRA|nr:hypothetical protein As57867_024439 [Aphanomyces stellatus]VFU01155.1 Aste57867_24516 [Aphanomyces stellatus]
MAIPVTSATAMDARDAADLPDKRLREKTLELEALQKEHDEYVRSSCEIEHELEAEVIRLEDIRAKLEEQVRRASDDQLAARASSDAASKELSKLHSIVSELMQANTGFKSDVQRLEQRNDDLERRERELQASIDDLEHQLDTSEEANVFLRQELDDLMGRLHADVENARAGMATRVPAAVNPLSAHAQFKYGGGVKSPPLSPGCGSDKPTMQRPSFYASRVANGCGPNCKLM